ncbi:MAG: Cache 3/Cache 2 fusion domain-containing protein [Pseudomonadota bacterium]
MLTAYRRLSLVSQISIILLGSISVAFLVITLLVNLRTSAAFQTKTQESFRNDLALVSQFLTLEYEGKTAVAAKMGEVFASLFPVRPMVEKQATIRVGEFDTPIMTSDGEILNLNFSHVDRFEEMTGGVATVFERLGDDFLRITTSLKKENGERALGTLLDRRHPAYAALREGRPYLGLARLFGRDYMTHYTPIIDHPRLSIRTRDDGEAIFEQIGPRAPSP